MKLQILKHTGEFETVQVEINGETVNQQQEILETVQELDFEESEKASVSKRAQLRSIMLSRDTGYKHGYKII